MKTTSRTALLVLVLAAACGAPETGGERTGILPDAGMGDDVPPPAPILDSLPARVASTTVAVRGIAPDAVRVIVEEADRSFVEEVLPDGSFCVTVDLDPRRSNDIVVWSQARSGAFSLMSAMGAVAHDPFVPEDPTVAGCRVVDRSGCMPLEDKCDDGLDDDCDGLVDGYDGDCGACDDDLLEPNDSEAAPRIEPGMYDGLVLCPGTRDNYPLRITAGAEVTARIRFAHARGDLDLALYSEDFMTAHATSATRDADFEVIRHTANTTGIYVLRVAGFEGAGNDYTLEVTIR